MIPPDWGHGVPRPQQSSCPWGPPVCGVLLAHCVAPAASPIPFCPNKPKKYNKGGKHPAKPRHPLHLTAERRGGTAAGQEGAEVSLGLLMLSLQKTHNPWAAFTGPGPSLRGEVCERSSDLGRTDAARPAQGSSTCGNQECIRTPGLSKGRGQGQGSPSRPRRAILHPHSSACCRWVPHTKHRGPKPTQGPTPSRGAGHQHQLKDRCTDVPVTPNTNLQCSNSHLRGGCR